MKAITILIAIAIIIIVAIAQWLKKTTTKKIEETYKDFPNYYISCGVPQGGVREYINIYREKSTNRTKVLKCLVIGISFLSATALINNEILAIALTAIVSIFVVGFIKSSITTRIYEKRFSYVDDDDE